MVCGRRRPDGSDMHVKGEVSPQPLLGLLAFCIVPQVELLALDRSLQSFDEHVVEGSAATVHRDGDAQMFVAGFDP